MFKKMAWGCSAHEVMSYPLIFEIINMFVVRPLHSLKSIIALPFDSLTTSVIPHCGRLLSYVTF